MSATEAPDEVANPDAEEEEEAEHIDGPDAPPDDPDAAAAPSAPSSEKAMQEADKAERAYKAKLDKILGPDPNRHDCAACNGLGIVWGDPQPEPELVHPDNLATCGDCNGYGFVETGSKNPDHATAICTTCSARGYVVKTEQASYPPLAPVPPVAGPDAPMMGQYVPGRGFIPFGQSDPIPGS